MKKAIFSLPILVVAILIFLRVFLYRSLPGVEYYFKYDEAIYAMLSQKFLHGDFNLGFHPYWNAGFPLVTIPFYLITRSWENAQILVSIVSHTLLVLVMYLTLRKISLSLALVASFFTAFSPSFTKLVTAGGVTEPFYILLFWLAVYFSWKAIITREVKQYAWAGFFFGLAYLTRTEVIYTLAAFSIFTILSFLLERRKNLISINKFTFLAVLGGIAAYLYLPLTRLSKFTTFYFEIFRSTRGILFALPFGLAALASMFFTRNKISVITGIKQVSQRLIILVIIFLLVNLPYIITISKNLGHLTLSGKYAYIGSGHPFTPDRDRLSTWAQDIWPIDFPNYQSPYYDSNKTLPIIWKYLDSALEATWKRLDTNINFFAHDNIFTDFEAALVLLGFIAGIWQAKFRKVIFYLFILWLASFVIISHFMDAAPRYLAFSFPIFYIAQAFAVVSIASLLSKIRPVFLPLAIIIFTLWYFNKNFDLKTSDSTRSSNNSDQKIIGDYLKSQGIDLVMARTEGISFYSDAKLVYIPAAPPEVVVEHAKVWGVPYILARPGELSWNYMRDIVNPKWQHPDLKLAHLFENGAILWQVKLTEEEKKFNYRTGKKIEVFCQADPFVPKGDLPICPDRTY